MSSASQTMQAKPLRAAIIKLGGSIVTDKGSDDLRICTDRIRRLAQEIKKAKLRSLVLVSGAGSYGHRIVARTGINKGVYSDQDRLAWAETQRLQYLLSAAIAEIFIEVGLPVIVHQASASAQMKAGFLQDMDISVCRGLLDQGVIPLLYGVPAWDKEQGCSILSGDQIVPFLGTKLGIVDLIYATDVDGVYDRAPDQIGAQQIATIDAHNWHEVQEQLGGSSHVDVTGGMAGKVAALMNVVKQGLRARIIDATIAGRLHQALQGESVGSLLRWEESRK